MYTHVAVGCKVCLGAWQRVAGVGKPAGMERGRRADKSGGAEGNLLPKFPRHVPIMWV